MAGDGGQEWAAGLPVGARLRGDVLDGRGSAPAGSAPAGSAPGGR